MKKIDDYVVEIINSDQIVLSLKVLTDLYSYEKDQIKELFQVSEIDLDKNFTLYREPDADLDDGEMVDVSTYYMKYDNFYSKDDNLAEEMWSEVTQIKSYHDKYLTY